MSENNIITFGKGRLLRKLIAVVGYLAIVFLMMMSISSVSLGHYSFAVIFFVVALFLAYLIWRLTRLITFDLNQRSVRISGYLRKRIQYKWEGYLGTNTLYTVKDFPETFYMLFRRREKVNKVRLVDITPIFRKYRPSNYEAILSLWSKIENKMNNNPNDEL